MYKETIHNPVTGETLYVLESNEDVFRIEYAIDPQSSIAAEHIHPYQQQTIRVIEGKLGIRANGRESLLEVGDSLEILAGTAHFQFNPTDSETRAIEEHRPARRIHNFFRVLFALAREGRTDQKGVPTPLIGAAFAREFKDVVRPSSIGLRLLFGALGPVSEILGYRRVIRDYIQRFEMDDIDRTPVISFFETPSSKHSKAISEVSYD